VRCNEIVAISGQGPIDSDGNVVGVTIREQTALTLENCKRQLESAGISLKNVFKVVVYLEDLAEWQAFNEVYRQYMSEPYPVRTAIQCVLWGHIKVEIDMLAIAG
jgi:2-iminobutanoate/2-iminopropanoate deaminase